MRYENVELFNVGEVEKLDNGMIRLRRYPEWVTTKLSIPVYDEEGKKIDVHTGHQAGARVCSGLEVRFLSDEKEIELTLSTENSVSVFAFCGDYQVGYYTFAAGVNTFKITRGPLIDGVKEKKAHRYSNRLWRLVLSSITPIAIRLGDFPREYPTKEDLPQKTMLAYGSSITRGDGTPFSTLAYIDVAAAELGIDVKNKAISGGCFCEDEVFEYFCQEEFDVGYFEMGTNIANRPDDVVEKKVGGFIDRICQRFAEKPMIFVTPVIGLSDVSALAPPYEKHFARTRRIIAEHAKKYPNAWLLDGHELLKEGWWLTHDVLHPSAFGHIKMGFTLAEMLRKIDVLR